MRKFNERYEQLMREMTCASTGVGGTATSTQSGDFYAPGDARTPTILGTTKGILKKRSVFKRNKRVKKESAPIIRRTFPGM